MEDSILDKIIELRKKIDKAHLILVSDWEEYIVELRYDLKINIGCSFTTGDKACKEKVIGVKHYCNNTQNYICKKHIKEQGYYKP